MPAFASDELGGSVTGRSGSYIRFSISLAWSAAADADGGRWRSFLRGGGPRSEEVGMDSGMGSDIFVGQTSLPDILCEERQGTKRGKVAVRMIMELFVVATRLNSLQGCDEYIRLLPRFR